MDGRPIWTDCDEAGDYVVPNVFSPRDLVFRPDYMDETVPHNSRAYIGWDVRGTSSTKQLELSASNTVKVDYRLPVTCSDFNSTTVNSLGLDFIDLLPVTLSISYRFLNVVSNTDFYAICSHYYHFF